MKIRKKEDILVLIYTYVGGKAINYDHNKDLVDNISQLINLVEPDETYLSIEPSYICIEEELLYKESVISEDILEDMPLDISEDISEAIDIFVIHNGVKFGSKILKYTVTSSNYILFLSFGWTIIAIDTNNRSDKILGEIIDTLNFIENFYYSNEPDFDLLNNESKNE